MDWILTSLQWYLFLLLIGIIFYPLSIKIFSPFFDKGYPFAKTLAILFLSYIIFIFGVVKILPFTQPSLILLIVISAIAYIVYFIKNPIGKKTLKNFISILPIIIIEELLFLIAFIFLTFIRGQEPSIRGLEKFMDFGFINSILRSQYFPPLDIWYSKLPINYYYFGHLTGAFLIKLTNIRASIGYNLILATIFAQAITLVFSIVGNIVFLFDKYVLKNKTINYLNVLFFGLLGSLIVNFGGNLHTIYLFTSGYAPENPTPFWNILSAYNPTKYWYPNATRFIPFTIHEFPSYSYVVADLHGHVFDIPFVLITIAFIFVLFVKKFNPKPPVAIFLGFMTAAHYMTNAFDGPIYLLLISLVFLIIYGVSQDLLVNFLLLCISFIVFSYPFSANFSPFVSGIGVNCSLDFLVNLHKLGPFLFEKGNCQADPFWMLFVLWGFFWITYAIFLVIRKTIDRKISNNKHFFYFESFIFVLFAFGTFLVIVPEFFYIKDIYPAHFRANTMFKLGYQAFIMMSIASVFVAYQIRLVQNLAIKNVLKLFFLIVLFFVLIYPFYSFTSYYGKLDRPVTLNGDKWLESSLPQDKEIIDFFNDNIEGQPTILEAQGDSYTDYERISAYTGLPTIAGWWVHEWLWRGSPDIVGKRIPDVADLYESRDIQLTKKLINKYKIKYIIVSKMERDKYKNLYEKKFNQICIKVFESSNGIGAVYQTNQY